MRLRFIALMVLILGSSMLMAQNDPLPAPGYLGHTNLVGGGILTYPRVGLDNCQRTWGGDLKCIREGQIAFSTSFTLGWEKVLSRRSALNLTTELFHSGGTVRVRNLYGDLVPTPTKIRMLGLGIGSRHYPFIRRGIPAPYGMYFSTLVLASGIFERIGPTPPVGFTPNSNFSNGLSLGFFGGTGRNFFLSDRLILDLGLRIGVYAVMPIQNRRLESDKIREDLRGLHTLRFVVRIWFLP